MRETDPRMLGFPPEVFAHRRERVLERLGKGVMVLPAAPTLIRSRDVELRYRPDSELFYVSGLMEPEAVAVLGGGGGSERFTLFVSPRDPEVELWKGARLGPERAKEIFDADAAFPIDELTKRLPALLAGTDRVFFRLGHESQAQAVVLAALESARQKGPRRGTGPRGIVDPGVVLDDLRLVKDAHEIDRIRRAAALSVAAFRTALDIVRPGLGEWELESVIDQAFRAGGGAGAAYPTIVGSGANACVLHYLENDSPIGEGDLVLVDAGAELDMYAADITRTFPASGRFSGVQRAVYEIVTRANRAAVRAVEPGSTIGDVHEAGLDVLVEGLAELNVLEGEAALLIEEEAYKPYFPHQTSHWLGLDVHDVGDYVLDAESRVLEPGMVLTVEPGLYFRPDLMEASAGGTDLSGIGVRIEDDVLVTADGHELLTSDLPVETGEIEELVG
ncbi:MAG: aminopeptidase P N-terminal domain-containing protein [Gemmatimonadota bacterium]|nr:MAG: aminopeptidase P N-terminal domain-containing protein [Gemmatimonadota bacterium]